MSGNPMPVRHGKTTEIVLAFNQMQTLIGTDLETNKVSNDCRELAKFLDKAPAIEYIKVVSRKPDGGLLMARGYYFKAYAVRRSPKSGEETWVLYIIPRK